MSMHLTVIKHLDKNNIRNHYIQGFTAYEFKIFGLKRKVFSRSFFTTVNSLCCLDVLA